MPGLVLALDASSIEMSAALAEDGGLLAEAIAAARSGPRLLALVADAFRAAGRAPAELESIVAVAGPGSFTGVRITLATALGLAPDRAAGGRPRLRTISTFAALALQAPAETRRLLAVVDALRGEVFLQELGRCGKRWTANHPPRRIATGALESGSDPAPVWTQQALPIDWPGELHLARPLAAAVAEHASRPDASDDPIFLDHLNPVYLRSAAVTLPNTGSR